MQIMRLITLSILGFSVAIAARADNSHKKDEIDKFITTHPSMASLGMPTPKLKDHPESALETEILVSEKLGTELSEANISWMDLQRYAVEKGQSLTVRLETEYLPSTAKAKTAEDLTEYCFSDDATPSLLRGTVSQINMDINNIEKKLGIRRAQTNIDDSVILDLYDLSKQMGKDLVSPEELKIIISDGQSFLRMSQHNIASKVHLLKADGSEASPEYILSAILWYLQAKSGTKFVLNPNTWKLERGFVSNGVFRIQDTDGGLYDVLSHFHSTYRRKSSHFKEETDSPNWFFTHKGFDVDPSLKIPLPGQVGTKTVLFGKLKNGEMFLKTETQGTDFRKPVEVAKHMLAFAEYSANKNKSTKKGYIHRELVPKQITEVFADFLKTQRDLTIEDARKKGILTAAYKHKIQSEYHAALDRGKTGLSEILQILNSSKNPSPENRAVLHMIENYISDICEGTSPETQNSMIVAIKGCESTITNEYPILSGIFK